MRSPRCPRPRPSGRPRPGVARRLALGLLAPLLLGGCPEEVAAPADLAARDAGPDAGRAARWTVIRRPAAGAANLFGLYGDAPERLFAVGSGGTILRSAPDPEGALDRDGRPLLTLSPMESGTTADLTAVHGTSGSDVYAVGLGGTILHYDGAAWQAEAPQKAMAGDAPFSADLWGVFAYQGGAIAVGQGGYWTRRVMGKWSVPQKLQVESLLGVWGAAPNAVYAVGSVGYIFFFDGNGWRSSASPAGFTGKLAGVFGSAGNNVYAVGLGGAVLRSGGGGFSDYGARADARCGGVLPKVFLRRGAVTAAGEVVVIGWEGVIARLVEGPCGDGGMGIGAFDESGATDRRLEGLWAQRDGQRTTLYVSGVEGVLLRGE